MALTDVATTLGREPAAVRQLASRARRHVQYARPRFALEATEADRIARAFFAAARDGDAAALSALLARDVEIHSDGGGKVIAFRNVVRGVERALRLFAGLRRKHRSDSISVGMLLSRQAGLPLWQRPLPPNALLDWDVAVTALVDEAPIWEPGLCHGYHLLTFGYLAGELVRRVAGKSVGAFLREEVEEPLGADVWIGLPEHGDHRVAPVILADPDTDSKMFEKMQSGPEWIGLKSVTNVSGWYESLNTAAFLRMESPAGSGIANARGLATMYAPLSLDGANQGVRLVRQEALPLMRNARAASEKDYILQIPTSFSLGFAKSWGGRAVQTGQGFAIGEHAFGAPGLGGSIGFAEPGWAAVTKSHSLSGRLPTIWA